MRRTTTLPGNANPARRDRHELHVTQGRDGSIVVTGDLDAASADMLDRALRNAETDLGDRPLMIDLQSVGFMDSSGLRTLVAASIRAARRGSRVALRNLGPELTRLLEITGLSDQFGLAQAAPTDRAWRMADNHAPTTAHPDHPDGRRS